MMDRVLVASTRRAVQAGASVEKLVPVIFATGDFGANFTNNSLLAMYRSELLQLPTNNGALCPGDTIKM